MPLSATKKTQNYLKAKILSRRDKIIVTLLLSDET